MSRLAELVAPAPAAAPPASRRSWWLPLLILGLLLGVFVLATWERFVPARVVAVERVVVRRGSGAASVAVDSVAFQAAGWIEADPLPARATALVSGVVATVAVLQGETVAAGQTLARLDDASFRLALAAAEAGAAGAAARLREAEAALPLLEVRRQGLVQAEAAAQARLDLQRDRAERRVAAGAAVAEGERREAALQQAVAAAELAAVAAELAGLEAERHSLEATVAVRRGERDAAAVAVRRAELDLDRCTIRAPLAGVVQVLHTVLGAKLMLDMDEPLSATVATLYDPAHLQARVDVALADAASLVIGQRVRLSCEVLPERVFAGRVVRIEGQADLQRNTLQAKVALAEPDPALRPDMLVRAQFLGTATAVMEDGEERLRLYVPEQVVPGGGETAELWVIDAEGRAARRTVRLGGLLDGHREVLEGLLAGEPVLRAAPADLVEGERVRIGEGE